MSYSLKSSNLKGVYVGECKGITNYYRAFEGDTRSLITLWLILRILGVRVYGLGLWLSDIIRYNGESNGQGNGR